MDNIKAESDSIKTVSPTPQVGAELIARVTAMEKAGVYPRDILIRTGYYKEGDDYGQANIDFFSAKLAAQKSDAGVFETQLETVAKEVAPEEENEAEEPEPQANFAAVISKLDAIAGELLKAEVWDEQRIQLIAGLRYIYKDWVGSDKELIEIYIKTCSGNIRHYLESQPIDALKNDKVWQEIESDLIGDAEHFYQGMLQEYDRFTHYLPEGWTAICFGDFDWEVKPLDGEQLLYVLHNNSPHVDAEKLFEENILDYERELCGKAMVVTGYLTNQENLKGKDLTVLQAYKRLISSIGKALNKETEAEEAVLKAGAEAKEQKRNSTQKEQRELKDSFQTALDSSYFDEVFKEAEKYKTLILEKIDDIASNFTEDIEYAASGEEPQWLLTALLQAGAEFGNGGGSDEDDDEEEYEVRKGLSRLHNDMWNYGITHTSVIEDVKRICKEKYAESGKGVAVFNLVSGSTSYFSSATLQDEINNPPNDFDASDHQFNQMLISKIEQHHFESGYLAMVIKAPGEPVFYEIAEETIKPEPEVADEEPSFEGKRVCITGKLDETRELWEAWIKDAGGTVASGVSKTTDYLIAGANAGNKLVKAADLGVTVLNEEQAKEILDYICEEIQENWADLIIEKMIKGITQTTAEGYFKITVKINYSIDEIILTDVSIGDVRDWLTERLGAKSEFAEYLEPQDVKQMQIEWIEADRVNNVTLWYYANDYGGCSSPSKIILNNRQDSVAYLHNVNMGWGGHLSLLRVVEKTGDTSTVLVGRDLTNAYGYDWGENLIEIFNRVDSYLDLFELISDDTEDAEKEVEEIIRKGLWPKL